MGATGRNLFWTIAAFVLITPIAVDAKEKHGGFHAVTGATALQGGFDVHGDQLAWTHVSGTQADIYLTNLSTGSDRFLTTIPASGPRPTIQDLGFDGRWVVWSDNRFGDLELFSLDTSNQKLTRLTDHPADDKEPFMDEGRLVWSREGSLWVVDDLEKPMPRSLPMGSGSAREPTFWDGRILWVQLDGSGRYLMQAGLDGQDSRPLWKVEGSFEHEPSSAEGALAWTSEVLLDPAMPGNGWAGTVLRSIGLPGSDAVNLTAPGRIEAFTVGPGRVVWASSDVNGSRVQVHDLVRGDSSTIPFRAGQLRASRDFLVATSAAEGSVGPLYARSWDFQDEEGRDFIPTVSLPGTFLIMLVLVVLVGRRG